MAAECRGVDAAALAARISGAVAQLSGPGPARRFRQRSPRRSPGSALPALDAADLASQRTSDGRRRRRPGRDRSLPSGGRPVRPGRTLVAANIAGELAAEGQSVLLVDADSYGASVAALLGLLDEAAGLAQACRLADQGLLDARRPAPGSPRPLPPSRGPSAC